MVVGIVVAVASYLSSNRGCTRSSRSGSSFSNGNHSCTPGQSTSTSTRESSSSRILVTVVKLVLVVITMNVNALVCVCVCRLSLCYRGLWVSAAPHRTPLRLPVCAQERPLEARRPRDSPQPLINPPLTSPG